MKNIGFLVILCFGFLFLTSCNNDEEDSPEAKIIGTWLVDNLDFEVLIESKTLSEFFGDQSSLVEALITSELESQLENLSLEFKSDKSFLIGLPDESTEQGLWSINDTGDQITFNEGTIIEGTYEVKSLTENYFIISGEQMNNSFDLNNDGLTEEVKITFDLYLIK